ncbi:MAG: hypothetical protein AAFO69_00205, partial [Bacteroidota bacterium]
MFGLLALVLISATNGYASDRAGLLTGNVKLDKRWDPIVYLSYIPSFEDMYTMSHDMIIASSAIDSSGNFSFDLSFLPAETNLYRLHLQKKGDSKSTLIIGGKEENFLLLFAQRDTFVDLAARGQSPPFSEVVFKSDMINRHFQEVNNLIAQGDSMAMESSAMKRAFILKRLEEDLLTIADTSSQALLAVYAFHRAQIASEDPRFKEFTDRYSTKWPQQTSQYDKSFRIENEKQSRNWTGIIIAGPVGITLIMIGFGLGRYLPRSQKQKKVKDLSLQERKVYDLLQKSASNKEISEEL